MRKWLVHIILVSVLILLLWGTNSKKSGVTKNTKRGPKKTKRRKRTKRPNGPIGGLGDSARRPSNGPISGLEDTRPILPGLMVPITNISPERRKELTRRLAKNPSKYFEDAGQHCAGDEEDLQQCYSMFKLFTEFYPTITAGHTNTAVALERLGYLKEAIDLYVKTLELFRDQPDSVLDAIRTSLLRVYSLDANVAFAKGEYMECLAIYSHIMKLVKDLSTRDSIPLSIQVDTYRNYANINERLHRFKKANWAFSKACLSRCSFLTPPFCNCGQGHTYFFLRLRFHLCFCVCL